MVQYPDTLVVTVNSTPSQGAGGIYTAGGTTTHTLKGRAEANGSGRRLDGPDGSVVNYAYLFFLPRITTVIPAGASYTLNGTIVGTVKRASNGQLNSRIWL